MINSILSLNCLAVLGTAVVGFLLGSIWFSPVLFAKPWMEEMKITEGMKQIAAEGMAGFFIKGFVFTLLSTFGLAVLIHACGSAGWLKGAEFVAFVASSWSAPAI